MMASPLMQENIWFDRLQAEDAEYKYYGNIANLPAGLPVQTSKPSSLRDEIARARENIKSSLTTGKGLTGTTESTGDVTSRIKALEKENQDLKQVTSELKTLVSRLQARVTGLEEAAGVKTAPALHKTPAPSKAQGEDEVDEDSDSDDDDLFGDSEESQKKAEELKKKIQEDSKKKKKVVVAKSSIVLDVKPMGDDTDMKDVEAKVRAITQEGLLWGAAKLVDVAYGIKKLQISCVIEDAKVSVDDLEDKITAFEDIVQSVDIAAFNKI